MKKSLKLYDTWERYFSPVHPKHKYQVSRFKWFYDRLTPGKFLDVGCAGGLGLWLAGKRNDITDLHGIDINPDSIQQAKERLGIYKNKNVVLHSGSADNIPENDLYFDCVMCGETLEHVKNDYAVMSEIGRVTASGGRLLVSVPYKGHLSKQHIRLYDNNSLKKLIENNNFYVITEDKMHASSKGYYLLMKATKL